ncbi:MAG TPA: class I tRNA ligase family protein, partial [Alphaproteobacteria bacterium]|nr:class I tRNA ligase family protein [Alphaproteobacteria bacterium]
RLMAPIMSFTAEEVWQSLPAVAGRPESVHMAYFPQAEEITGKIADAAASQKVRDDFQSLMSVREVALKALEEARQDKTIGSALEATVTITAPADLAGLLERYRDDLRFLLIVSGVEIRRAPAGNGSAPVHVQVTKAQGRKCDRCWNYSTQVGASTRYPTVCERCLAALEEIEKALPA